MTDQHCQTESFQHKASPFQNIPRVCRWASASRRSGPCRIHTALASPSNRRPMGGEWVCQFYVIVFHCVCIGGVAVSIRFKNKKKPGRRDRRHSSRGHPGWWHIPASDRLGYFVVVDWTLSSVLLILPLALWLTTAFSIISTSGPWFVLFSHPVMKASPLWCRMTTCFPL